MKWRWNIADMWKTIKGFCKKAYKCIKEHHVLQCFLFTVISLFLWWNFESEIRVYFDEVFLPFLDFKNTWALKTITAICICVMAHSVYKKFKSTHVFYCCHFSILSIFVFILSYYRLQNLYNYLDFLWEITYVDLVIIVCIFNLLLSVVNQIRRCINGKEPRTNPFDDHPIELEKEDLLDYCTEARALTEYIENLPSDKVWSIGITSEWGEGKTSFLNLTRMFLDNEKFLMVDFNPRNSKSVATIQEDFFSALCSKLSGYSSAVSSRMKDYMAALKLIDNRNVLQRLFSIYKIWDKQSTKEKVDSVLKTLPVKVVVIIDDFDRLLSNEIIEVFKLIDSNAAFCNIVFLTAYDKEHVKTVLGKSYQNGTTDFSDKFFNYEKPLSVRPYKVLFSHFKNLIFGELSFNEEDSKVIRQQVDSCQPYMESYIPTMRDIKRFAQLLVLDYKQVEGEVDFRDFLLIEIIKYKFPEEYKKIWKMTIFETPSILSSSEYIYLNKEMTQNMKANLLLTGMFPSKESIGGYRYRRINERKSFNMYFVGKANPKILLKDMRKVLLSPIADSKKQISEWFSAELYQEFTDFIDEKSEEYVYDGNSLKNYVSLLMYLASFEMDQNVYRKLLYMAKEEIFNRYRNALKISVEGYKELFIESYKENPDSIRFFIDLSERISDGDSRIQGFVFTKQELRDLICSEFDRYASLTASCDDGMISRLYGCVDHIEEQSRIIILDKQRCKVVKEKIINGPDYYINTFLRLGMISSDPNSNSAACEPFWRQIFETPENFESFLSSSKCDSCKKIKSVREFWEIYKANEYKQIEFSGLGNSQKILEAGFAPLYSLFKELKSCETRLIQYKEQWEENKNKRKAQQLKTEIELLLNELDKNKLYIKFHGELRDKITSFITDLSNFIAHALDVRKGEVNIKDFVRIRSEFYNKYEGKTIFAENVFEINEFIDDKVRLIGLDSEVPISELEYIPIDGVSDKCIYYDPIIAPHYVAPGQPVPVHHTDYSYYMEALERTIDEKGESYANKVSKYEYVHQVQQFLRKRNKHEDLRINHNIKTV